MARRMAYAALLLTSGVACLALAFAAAQYTGGPTRPNIAPTPANLEEAAALRSAANQLIDLHGDLMARTPTAADATAWQTWVRGTFEPEIRALRRQLVAAPSADPSVDLMLRAVQALESLARQPGEGALKDRATARVRSAFTAAEARIEALDAASHLSEPARLMPQR